MFYKVYNELPGVSTLPKTLISVICYNAYNLMEWGTRAGAMCSRGNTPCLMPTGHQTGANVQPWQYSLPDANGDTRRAQMCSRGNTPCLLPTGHQTGAKTKNGLQIFCRPGTAKTFYIIHYILQIPDLVPDI